VSPGQLRCGVELDRPIGLNNGTVDSHCYFKCTEKHGVLVVASKVWLLSNVPVIGSPMGTYTRPIAQERLVKLDAERRSALKAERAALKDVKRQFFLGILVFIMSWLGFVVHCVLVLIVRFQASVPAHTPCILSANPRIVAARGLGGGPRVICAA
jgi:hypothetical protein